MIRLIIEIVTAILAAIILAVIYWAIVSIFGLTVEAYGWRG